MTRTERKTAVELFGETVQLSDITADITVSADAEAPSLADENGWDDIELIGKACALSLALTKDGQRVFESGVSVLQTLTETEIRRLYDMSQGRESDIAQLYDDDEEEESARPTGETYAKSRTPAVQTRYFTVTGMRSRDGESTDEEFASLGIFSENTAEERSMRERCERISEFICRDARRYDDELTLY